MIGSSFGLFFNGLAMASTPEMLLYAFIGAVMGTAVGVLPGLGPTATIALLFPVTMNASPLVSIVMLAGVYYGAQYGGSTTAILVNVPGEASSVVTAIDGYMMAKKGEAGLALSVAAIASFVAGVMGLIGLVLIAPPLAEFALAFGPPEYFALSVLAMVLIVGLSGRNIIKGLTAGLLGLLCALVGQDPISGYPRFTGGIFDLVGGIDVIVAAVGLFGISEVLINATAPGGSIYAKISRIYPTLAELKRIISPTMRSAVMGFFPGLVPGGSPAVASFLAYEVEKAFSRDKGMGSGAMEGVVAPEGANNANVSAAFVPLFTLGLPTCPPMALLLAVLTVHGLRPGPMLFQQQPDFLWTVIGSMFVGNVMCLVLNLPLIRIWARATSIPNRYLAPGIVVVCMIGAFSVRNSVFDVWLAVFFGVLGWTMRSAGYPLAPMLLAMIVGPMLERTFGQTYSMLNGITPIIHRPISMVMLMCALAYLAGLQIFRWYSIRRGAG